MTKVPHVTASRLLNALRRAGFEEVHRKDSHVMLAHRSDPTRVAVVPVHKGATVKPGTLRAILASARIGVRELHALL